jgi:ABC-type transport system involved in multi-copper enzyme maturation permease subunit
MTRTPSLLPLIAKECRALLPIWLAALVTLVAGFALRSRAYSDLVLLGYISGVVSIGAYSVGHEYGHRTLATLLVQPLSRWRVFVVKFAVTAAVVATVATAAALMFTTDRFRTDDTTTLVALPVLAALFFAPLCTMLCRNTLAGAILGVSGPMTIWVLALVVAWWGFGIDGDSVSAWFLARWPVLSLIACPIFGVFTWRVFNRIEAVDGMPATLTLPRWTSRQSGVRRAAPWRALIAKEIHLQQMTIVITLLYGVIWVIGVALRETMPASVMLPLEAVLLLYCLGLAIVIGAVASAEERQQGTLQVQLLQPVSAVAQWMVKCAVVLTLATIMAVILPALLIAAFSGTSPVELSTNLVPLVVLLASSSLYISSLAGSGVKAMAWSLPAGIGAAMFIHTTQTAIASTSMRFGTPLPADQTEASVIAGQLLPVLLVPLLVWFGFVNHTSAEHSGRRTAAQVGVLALVLVAVIVAAGALV